MANNALSIITHEALLRGLDPKPMVERCEHGFTVYGAENHLQPDFEVWREVIEELWDAFNITCFKIDAGANVASVDEILNTISNSIKLVYEQMEG